MEDPENVSVGGSRRRDGIISFRQWLTPPIPHRYIDRSEIEWAKRGCRFYRFVLNFSMVDPKNVSRCSPRLDGNFFVSSLSNTLPYPMGTSIDQKLNGLSGNVGLFGVFEFFLWSIRKN